MAKRLHLFDEATWDKVHKENKALLDDYILELKSNGKSEKTIYQYKADIRGFFCWLVREDMNKSALELKKRAFRGFFLMMKENGTSAARINRFQSSIRNLLEFAVIDDDEYDYDINAMRSIKGLEKTSVREIHFLTDAQVTHILAHLIKKEQYQRALFLSLSYDSAGRRNEVLQVGKTDFLKNTQTNVVVGKRGKKFSLLYFDRTKRIADIYFEQRGEDDIESLWIAGIGENRRAASYELLYSWVLGFRKILLDDIGIDIDINPHSLRHSSLNNYENGTHYTLKQLGKDRLPIEVLKLLAHHENIDTTQSYLENKDEEILNNAFGL